MTRCDRYQMGNLDWQVRHLATLIDHMPTMVDIEELVRRSTTLHVNNAQLARLLTTAEWAYEQYKVSAAGQALQPS